MTLDQHLETNRGNKFIKYIKTTLSKVLDCDVNYLLLRSQFNNFVVENSILASSFEVRITVFFRSKLLLVVSVIIRYAETEVEPVSHLLT